MNESLTQKEQTTVQMLGKIYTLIVEIIQEGRAPEVVEGDKAEAAFYIHGLQNMILAQAAARDYPTQFRTMGSRIG